MFAPKLGHPFCKDNAGFGQTNPRHELSEPFKKSFDDQIPRRPANLATSLGTTARPQHRRDMRLESVGTARQNRQRHDLVVPAGIGKAYTPPQKRQRHLVIAGGGVGIDAEVVALPRQYIGPIARVARAVLGRRQPVKKLLQQPGFAKPRFRQQDDHTRSRRAGVGCRFISGLQRRHLDRPRTEDAMPRYRLARPGIRFHRSAPRLTR